MLDPQWMDPAYVWTLAGQRPSGRFFDPLHPTSASWMNMVGIWFSIVTKQQVRRGVYDDVPTDLSDRHFIDGYDERARPFVWTRTAEQILAKAVKRQDTSETDGLVQRCGQSPARLAGQRVLDAELVQDAHHDAANVIPGSVRLGQRADEQIECQLAVIVVERRERALELAAGVVLFEPNPGREPVSGEAPRNAGENRQRALAVAAAVEDPGQRHGRIGPAGFELHRAPQGGFIALGHEPVSLGWDELVKEALDGQRWLSSHELRRHRSVPEGLDSWDALNPEGAGQVLVRVDVDLDQIDLAGPPLGGPLEHRTQLPAGGAPLSPEIHHYGDGVRAVENGGLKVLF
jgi:hypothetical protein